MTNPNARTARTAEINHATKSARLSYVTDDSSGITRHRHGSSFVYQRPGGQILTDPAALDRIRKLAIPPAWEDVWICPKPRGHIQAVGRDARGRKQYKYHADWRVARDGYKYNHVLDFARALPTIRRVTSRHLRKRGLPREKVLAAVVQVMEKTLIRIGNDEYARTNHSFGLTTLRNRHATVRAKKITFNFRGKSGVEHEIDLRDAKLAAIVKKCQELPNHDLFNYVDETGQVKDISSTDVNDYLREIAGKEFTAKDFRTWGGTVLAAKALKAMESEGSKTAIRRNMLAAIDKVAERLGNTKAVCRKCYIHPAVLEAYIDGDLARRLRGRVREELKIATRFALDNEEASVLRMLERGL
ncbi:DNA topoisomerase IB [soil metagenome]